LPAPFVSPAAAAATTSTAIWSPSAHRISTAAAATVATPWLRVPVLEFSATAAAAPSAAAAATADSLRGWPLRWIRADIAAVVGLADGPALGHTGSLCPAAAAQLLAASNSSGPTAATATATTLPPWLWRQSQLADGL
ncbi:hypothetical protein GGF37_005424, partial [Kickxella alabastrina]